MILRCYKFFYIKNVVVEQCLLTFGHVAVTMIEVKLTNIITAIHSLITAFMMLIKVHVLLG